MRAILRDMGAFLRQEPFDGQTDPAGEERGGGAVLFSTRTGAGIALRESGRPREAVPLLQAAARETAESWPQTELGRTLLALGDPDGARAAMEEAVRRNPADVDAWRGIAVVRLGQGEPDEAASAFREALHLVPDHVEGLVGLGTAEAAAGHPVRARQAFQEALRLAPEHPGARQGLQELGARKVEEPGRSPGNAP